MSGKIFGILSLISLVFALWQGNLAALSEAILEGPSAALSLSLTLLGTLCFWSGIMEVLKDAGAIDRLTGLFRPFLHFFFPSIGEDRGEREVAAAISANLLGIGNAATPLALAALEKMRKHAGKAALPTADMITFTVMSTAPPALLPTTILTLLKKSGAVHASQVIVPIWLCSFLCWLFALLLCRSVGLLVGAREAPRVD